MDHQSRQNTGLTIRALFGVGMFAAILVPAHVSARSYIIDIAALVPGCGDGVVDVGESCDSANLAGQSCATLGFSGGALACTASCTFNVTSCTTGSGSGGGGGGGSGSGNVGQTGVVVEGRAYPQSTVTLLKDGRIAATTIAGPDARFRIELTGLSRGTYRFGVYGEDRSRVRSRPFMFSVFVTRGAMTTVGGIYIAPTLSADKIEVRRGDTLRFFGQTNPSSDITLEVNSETQIFASARAGSDGVYLHNFNTGVLEFGDHTAQAKSEMQNEVSDASKSVGFKVGIQNVATPASSSCPVKADVNNDCKVNLVDFSIAAFWYRKNLSAAFLEIERTKLSGDGKVDLIDMSIMAFHWTG